MSVQTDYTPMHGGLDFLSGSVAVKPGRLSECMNFEQVFGRQGYRRIDGYERFDGRPQPHKAQYHFVDFSGGESEVTSGESIFGATSEGKVLDVILTSGAWDGTAAGRIVYLPITGLFVTGQTIRKTSSVGPVVGTVAASSQVGRASSVTGHLDYLRTAQTLRRAAILKVPGSGDISGVAVFRGAVLAFRDAADGASATMWKSTANGWEAVRHGLRPGGSYEFVIANFSGDATRTCLYGVDGKNNPFQWDGAVYTEIPSIMGSQATSSTSASVGTGSKTLSVHEASRSWSVGTKLTVYSASSGASMTGSVTAYTHPSVTIDVTSVAGSGTFTDWRLGLDSGDDVPYLLTAHKDHLFLAYPRGQLQTSNLGSPLTFTTTATLFGVGEEITGLTSLKGAVLGIFCENKVHLLEGSSKSDWSMSLHSQNIGTKLYTLQENAGNAIMVGRRGMMSLQASQNFGSFEPAIWSREVKPYLDDRLKDVVTTRLVRGKYQLRTYFSDGAVLSACITTPNPAIDPRDVSFLLSKYNHVASCVFTGEYEGEEMMVFGTADGWVMREDVGQSFDGEPIDAFMRTHFNHLKSPTNKKRFHKLTMEADSPDPVEVKFLQLFDLADSIYRRGETLAMPAQIVTSVAASVGTMGVGGAWNANEWDTFYWSRPLATQAEANIDGIGRNMGLLIWCRGDVEESITVQGLLLQYAVLGMTR